MNARRIPTVLLAAAATLFPALAGSWTQMYKPGADGQAIPLSWPVSSYPYSVNENGSEDIPFDELEALVRACFDEWEDVECSYFSFAETAPAQTERVEFNETHGNVNLLVWRETAEEWPASAAVMGLTTVTYDKETGDILDVDMELNGANNDFANLDAYPEDTSLTDMSNVISHEIGHALGLDHSSDVEATMFPGSAPGDTEKRDLAQDDRDGLCALYPLDEDPGVEGEPHCGLQLDGADDGCDDVGNDNTRCDCESVGAAGALSTRLVGLLLEIL